MQKQILIVILMAGCFLAGALMRDVVPLPFQVHDQNPGEIQTNRSTPLRVSQDSSVGNPVGNGRIPYSIPAATDEILPGIRLVRITRGSSNGSITTALIEDSSGRQRSYEPGQEVTDGYRLAEIRGTRATLVSSTGQSVNLSVGSHPDTVATPEMIPMRANHPEVILASPLMGATQIAQPSGLSEEQIDSLFEPDPVGASMFDLPQVSQSVESNDSIAQ